MPSIRDVFDIEGFKYRILYIDKQIDIVYLIDIESSKAKPIKKKLSEILIMFKEGRCVACDDPFSFLNRISLMEKEKHIEIRDEAYKIISELIKEENLPYLYEPRHRVVLIKEKCLDKGIAKSSVYRQLKRYWQRGMTINSLLPDYYNCGNKGINNSVATSKFQVNIDDKITKKDSEVLIEDIFNYSIEKWYINSNKKTLTHTYKNMVEHFFSNNHNNVPSLRQFRYWYNRKNDVLNRKIKLIERDVDCSDCKATETIIKVDDVNIEKVNLDNAFKNSYKTNHCKNVGFVYIIENECMPHLYKIGKTKKDVNRRLQQISSNTGVPKPFTEVFSFLVPDSNLFEKELHKFFSKERVNSKREFFKIEDRYKMVSDAISLALKIFSEEDFSGSDELKKSYESIIKTSNIFK